MYCQVPSALPDTPANACKCHYCRRFSGLARHAACGVASVVLLASLTDCSKFPLPAQPWENIYVPTPANSNKKADDCLDADLPPPC